MSYTFPCIALIFQDLTGSVSHHILPNKYVHSDVWHMQFLWCIAKYNGSSLSVICIICIICHIRHWNSEYNHCGQLWGPVYFMRGSINLVIMHNSSLLCVIMAGVFSWCILLKCNNEVWIVFHVTSNGPRWFILSRSSSSTHHPIEGMRGSMLHYTAWSAIAKRLRRSGWCSQSSNNLQIHKFAVSHSVDTAENREFWLILDRASSSVCRRNCHDSKCGRTDYSPYATCADRHHYRLSLW